MKRSTFVLWLLTAGALAAVWWWSRPEEHRTVAAIDPTAPAATVGAQAPAAPAKPLAPATPSDDVATVPAVSRALVFGASGPVRLADVPAGRFHDQLVRLSVPARQKALDKLGRLRVPFNDVGSLAVDDDGALFYECAPPDALAAPVEASAGSAVEQGAGVPISAPPVRHSRPGSLNVIYLDFSGHTITGTSWNNAKGAPGDATYRPAVATYVAKPFDNDGDPTTFSDGEQLYIDQVWKRVAEDYVGFDVDVTTEEPAAFTTTTGRVLITSSVDANGVNLPSPTAGGVAYIDVFGSGTYVTSHSPAFVYTNNLQGIASYVAEAVSHEMGHNLSLSHDGTPTSEYYRGHGSGETSWAPIMGSAYSVNVSQWSKGEYYNSNNSQDDLALIAAHLGYAPDDHADTKAAASALAVSGVSFTGQGVIGAPGDADWSTLTTATDRVLRLFVAPLRFNEWTYGGNLDVQLELYDAAGKLVARDTTASVNTTSATLETAVAAGAYFLKVTGTGVGQPLVNPPTGYTAYGSLGQYTITGTLSAPVAPTITGQPNSQALQAGQSAGFYVYISAGSPAADVRWQRLPAGATGWEDLTDNSDYNTTGTTQLLLPAATLAMNGDQFRCRISNIAGEVFSQAVLLTVSPAVAPQIYSMPAFLPVDYGETLSISPSRSGTSPMSYVWKKDGVVIVGATASSFYKTGLTTADSGLYTLTATNQAGTTTSAGTTVLVNPPVAPAIYYVPQTVVQSYGGSFSFYPTVTGTRAITYQWKKDGVAIAGATSVSYYRSSLTPADSGLYQLTATNAWGAATSAAISVTVSAATAPAIAGLPASLAASYGNSINLSPTVTGSAPLSFQWSKDGLPITGATSSSYYKSGATPADSGVYVLTATNAWGTVTSAGVTVTVDKAVLPVISGLPGSSTLNYGDYLSLSASVSGTSPMSYVWKKDGVVITGANSSSFSKSGMTPADSGSYTLTVSNVAGSTTSPGVAVTVLPASAPVIFNLPGTVVVAYGQTLSLSPAVLGTTPITFRWQKNGVNVPGATSSSFNKSGVTAADAGTYQLFATNAAGSATSSVVTVLVDAALVPAVYGLPDARTVAYGNSLYLSPSITGTPPMTYQWMKDNQPLVGQTSSSLSKSGLTAVDAGSYTLTVTNAWGSTTSQAVAVTVSAPAPPVIYSIPLSVTAASGDSFSISASVSGTSPITYEWKKDGVVITGATSSYFSKSNASPADNGIYTLTATNLAGSATSSGTTVKVAPPVLPSISNLGGPLVVNYGESMSFYPSVSGTGPMTYQWKKDGVALPQGTSYYYSKNPLTTADSGSYTLTATNVVGSVTSAAVAVTVNPPLAPAVFGLPTVVAVNYGEYLSLSPSVTGTSPRTYRWQKDGVDLPNGTNAGFSKSGVTGADSGVYTLIVTNDFGSATSAPVTVVVNAAVAPGIYNVSPALILEYGASLSIYPTVTGTSPISYQWKKDGVAIAGATSSSFYKSYAATADSGQYTLTATNIAGTTVSPAITVSVRPAIPPTFTIQPVPVVAAPGRTAAFAAQGAGTSPLSFQWYRDGQLLVGATANVLSIGNLKAADFGGYHVVITNPGGSVTSAVVALTPDSGLAVDAVSAGSDRSFWIRSDGTLWGAGYNYYGQLGDGTTANRSNARLIATGVAAVNSDSSSHTLFRKLDGTLWAMGSNDAGQFGNGFFTASSVPLQIATDVTALAAGYNTSYFIKTDGTLWAMGENYNGQLGDGTLNSRSQPVQVATGVTAVAACGRHALFIKADATLWAMGENFGGQLGDGTTTSRSQPVQVASQVVAITTGVSRCSLFLKQDGSLWGMGANNSGELGLGTTTQQVTPVQVALHVAAVSAGGYHTLFVTTDHRLWGMGQNYSSQLGDGSTSSRLSPVEIAADVEKISAGSNHSLFTKTDGTLWGMGSNNSGQLGDGTTSIPTGYLPEQLTWSASVAPVIRSQPASQDILVGSNGSFYVSAYGGYPRTYQWERLPAGGSWGALGAGNGYSGVTSNTLAVTGATQAMNGDQFRCVVTNALGAATSGAATLTVTVPLPVITAQPAGQTVLAGTPVTLSVTASSPVALTYQWRKDGADLPGATAASYPIASVGPGDVGSYTVVVTNSAGSVTSSAALLAIALPPVITTPPATQAAYVGAPTTFSVTATSSTPLTYAWRKNNTPIAGATSADFVIASTQLADAGDYTVTVTNVVGSVTSAAATLTVTLPVAPVVTTQPVDRAVITGGTTRFTIAASGLPPPAFQWQTAPAGSGTWANLADGGPYSGAQTATLTVTGAPLTLNGYQYRCRASNLAGPVTSNAATLTVAAAGFTKLSAGRYHSLRLDVTAQLAASGYNTYGQLGSGAVASSNTPLPLILVGQTIADLAAGAQHSLILSTTKELWVTGYNGTGQLGDGTQVAKSTPLQIATNVAGMAAAVFHSAYIKTDGTLWTMGGNDSGQLGNGTLTDSTTATQVATNVVDVALGNRQSFFIKSDGTLWGMGDMNGSGTPVSTPVQIATNVTAVAAGAYHSLILKTDGTLWALGYNVYGQLGTGDNTDRLTPVQVATGVKAVAAGYFHSAYLKTDGSLWLMGYNSGGQLGDGTATNRATPFQLATNVAAVTASEAYTLFTKLDGSLWGTGYNAYGQFGNGGTATVSTPVLISTGVVLAPVVPTGLGASTTTLDRVRLLWSPAADAQSYEVWRNTVNDSSTATRLAQGLRWAIYQDLTAATNQTYYYWTKAVNPAGTSAFSAPALGSSSNAVAPSITTQPASQTVNVGDSVTFTVVADGTGPFTYQWRKGATNIPAETSAGYTIASAVVADAGSYDVVVTNSAGNTTSSAATLTVNPLSQTITFNTLADRAYSAVPFTLSATASSGLPVTFSILTGPATLSGNNVTLTGTGAVTVRAAQAGDATYAAATDVDRSFTVTANFSSWTQGKFTADELLNHPELTGPNAVYGADGLPNLLKYALGLEPKQEITSGLPEVSTTASDWVYTYVRPITTTDLTYEVEVSTNLTTWTTTGVTHELVTTGAGTETWRGRFPLASAANAYFRLKVTRP